MKDHLRNKFLAGTFAAVPLAVTVAVIAYVEAQTRRLFRTEIPFLGVGIAIVGIYLLGVLVTSILGKWVLRCVDRLLSRMPLLRELYTAWKQVTVTSGGSHGIFTRVALIPSGDGSMLGFSNGLPIPGEPATTCVFVPAAPNPMSGRLYFVPLCDCRFIDVASEEAFKMILSGGNYIPPGIARSAERVA